MTVPYSDPANVGNAPGNGPLRANGVSVGVIPAGESNLPSRRSQASEGQQSALEIMRDTAQGNRKVKARTTAYLPMAPAEKPANYASRLSRSVFFNVVGRTIEGLVGQIFRKDPVLGADVPASIKAHCENIDLCGTHLDVFARQLETDAVGAGHNAILVDFAATDGTQSAGDEQSMRPYWIPIRKEDILSWRTANVNGSITLTQLVLRECHTVPAGEFGEKEQTRYRVLYRSLIHDVDLPPVGYALLEIAEDRSVVVVERGYYRNQVDIPVSENVTSGHTAMFESDPPLLDLAYVNIAHYQQWSDYANSIHKTCVPLLTLLGFEDDTSLEIGPNSAIRSSNPQAKVEYISHSGQSLAQCKAALDDLKSDMGTLGISMLSPSKRTAETAQAKRLDKSTEESALAVTARGLQDCLEKALGFHARYMKLPTGGSVAINRDFDEQTMQSDMLAAWTGATAAGLPPRLQITAMQGGGLIDPGEDVQDIADEIASTAAANRDAQQQAARDLIAAKQSPPPVA